MDPSSLAACTLPGVDKVVSPGVDGQLGTPSIPQSLRVVGQVEESPHDEFFIPLTRLGSETLVAPG